MSRIKKMVLELCPNGVKYKKLEELVQKFLSVLMAIWHRNIQKCIRTVIC